MPRIEPLGLVRTKIVATVGPACREVPMLRRLVEAGVDIFRLNFSHGTHDEHSEVLASIRQISAETGRIVAVLQDLCGPKIRLGPLADDSVDCREGEEYYLVRELPREPHPHYFTCTYENLIDDLRVGEILYLADGAVAMEAREVSASFARLEVIQSGRIRSRQGINLPGTELRVESLTAEDLKALDWTATHPVDYIGLSFVRRADDVLRLRKEMQSRGIDAHIIAKIEKPQALANLDAILAVTDAVMVARGDLGVELDVAQVPAVQKRIITSCHQARVPVITATQMLASMENSKRPTRAEASDVFNAILDGTDAVMLSGETAVGNYPVDAVAMMSRIAEEAERMLEKDGGYPHPGPARRDEWITPVTESVVEAASLACRHVKASLLIAVTSTGRTALAVSKLRNAARTLALGNNLPIARRMALYWGVNPVICPTEVDPEQLLRFALDWAHQHDLIGPGERVVLLRGVTPDSTIHNALLVHEEPMPEAPTL